MTMVKRKYGFALGTSMVLLAGLAAGCSGSNNEGASPSASTSESAPASGSAAASGSASASAAPSQDLSPITYTINTSDDKLTWESPITKKLTEKTGVSLKYDLTVGDQFQKWDLWLASNDYPDIISLDPKYTQKYKDAGAIIPLNDLIDQYGPHIKEKFGKYYNLLKDKDGKIYALYNVNASQEASPDATGSFIIQQDVLKEAGYPQVKTLDQLYELIKAYKEKHPKVDGKETIGFAAAMLSYTMNISFNNPIVSSNGWPDNGNFKVEDNGDVNYIPVTEDAKSYYKFLNKLYREGLFDKEAFSMDSIQAKISQGRVLAAYAPGWFLGDSEKALRAAGKPGSTYAHLPIYANENVEDHSNAMTPTAGGGLSWTISAGAKNPERIIQFIDYLFSDEGQVLTQWGIEGEDYNVEGGKRVVAEGLLAQRNADPDVDYKRGFKSTGTGGAPWFGIGNGAKLADGDYATPLTKDSVVQTYDDTTKETLAAYGKQVWADFLPPVNFVPGYLWQLTPPESVKVQQQKIDDAWRKNLPKIVMSKSDTEFEGAWTTMVNSIQKSGLDDMNKAYTQLWADFNATYESTIGG